MKQLIKRALKAVGLATAAATFLRVCDDVRWRRKRHALVTAYLAKPGPRKLHIGSGQNLLSGWLNSDYYPRSPEVLHLDATKPFPFDDATFDFVFSEHMIEHVPYPAGCHMLRECLRVLKPRGVARISTPDLNFLIKLYEGNKTGLQQDYIKWSQQNFVPWAAEASDTFVINNFVRDWGHVFIYDEKTLRQAMENAGFSAIERCELQHSLRAELQNLENEGRMPAGFLRLETVTLEGTR
jgi:predicted SAM-dependent methyltransferase